MSGYTERGCSECGHQPAPWIDRRNHVYCDGCRPRSMLARCMTFLSREYPTTGPGSTS